MLGSTVRMPYCRTVEFALPRDGGIGVGLLAVTCGLEGQ
jgi:hypothetical protein